MTQIINYESCPVCGKKMPEWTALGFINQPIDSTRLERSCSDNYPHFKELHKKYEHYQLHTIWIETEDDRGGIDRLEIEYRFNSGRAPMKVFYNELRDYDFHYIVRNFVDIEDTLRNIERLSHFK